MEKAAPQSSGPPPAAGVKRPPPLMSGVGPRPPNDSLPPPPPGGMSVPPLPPGAPGAPHMPPQMPMPPMPMRPPPPEGISLSNNWSSTSVSWSPPSVVCCHSAGLQCLPSDTFRFFFCYFYKWCPHLVDFYTFVWFMQMCTAARLITLFCINTYILDMELWLNIAHLLRCFCN